MGRERGREREGEREGQRNRKRGRERERESGGEGEETKRGREEERKRRIGRGEGIKHVYVLHRILYCVIIKYYKTRLEWRLYDYTCTD